MVSNLNEMARKMSKLSGEIVRNDTADLGGEPVEEEEGGFATSRSSRRASSGHVRGTSPHVDALEKRLARWEE